MKNMTRKTNDCLVMGIFSKNVIFHGGLDYIEISHKEF